MAGAERVVFALGALAEARQAVRLTQRADAVAPAGQDLMRVGLVTDVPDQFVMRRVEDMVQRDGQLDHAKPRAEMAAGDSNRGDQLLPKLLGELLQLIVLQRAQIPGVRIRSSNGVVLSALIRITRRCKEKDWRINALSTFIGREPCLQLSRKPGQIVSGARIMRNAATIAEWPTPPKRRLSFPRMMLQMLSNPASWSEDFYREKLVVYRWLGLESAFVMDPPLIQRVLLDDAESFSKQPLNDDVFGEAIGSGLLNAEGEAWRWQRRLTAPLFRVEDVLAYVPAFAEAAGRCSNAGASAARNGPSDNRDMTRATLQALQDTVLGASLGEEDRRNLSNRPAPRFSAIRSGRSRSPRSACRHGSRIRDRGP